MKKMVKIPKTTLKRRKLNDNKPAYEITFLNGTVVVKYNGKELGVIPPPGTAS